MRISFKNGSGSRRKAWAFTLMEMLISAGLGVLIIGSMSSVFLLMNRALNGLGNYEELDRQSRYALDCMTRDMRQTAYLTQYNTTTLWFTNDDGSLLEYNYVTNQHSLFCYNSGVTNALLTNCTSLTFSIYQRTPSNSTTMTFFPLGTNTASKAKVVVVNWICTKTNYITLTDSESVQTAKIVLRN